MRSSVGSSEATRRLLSTGAAAEAVGCHRATVLRAIERGELRAFRLGANGDYRLRPEWLEAWLRPAGDPEPKETA